MERREREGGKADGREGRNKGRKEGRKEREKEIEREREEKLIIMITCIILSTLEPNLIVVFYALRIYFAISLINIHLIIVLD